MNKTKILKIFNVSLKLLFKNPMRSNKILILALLTSLCVPFLENYHALAMEQDRDLGGSNVPRSPVTRSAFEQNLDDEERVCNTIKLLISFGIEPTEDNIASRFLSEEALSQRLIDNRHGSVLNLAWTSFTNDKSKLIFKALRYNKRVRHLDLSNDIIPPEYCRVLSASLTTNKSLRSINFTDAGLPTDVLEIFGAVLRRNDSLQKIKMPSKVDFCDKDVTDFYKLISLNRGLRLIIWPERILPCLEWLANSKKNPVAMIHMGYLYAQGMIQKEKNILTFYSTSPQIPSSSQEENAQKHFEHADQCNHPIASYELGKIFEKQEKYEKAFNSYERSAILGYPAAQYKMVKYFQGFWPPKSLLQQPNNAKSFYWCKKSAEQEFPQALYSLGRMFQSGRGTPSDLPEEEALEKAAIYFYQAAVLGYPEAILALGVLYSDPCYPHCNEVMAQYYLGWSMKFSSVSKKAERLLKELTQNKFHHFSKRGENKEYTSTEILLELQHKADRKDAEACFALGKYIFEEEDDYQNLSDMERYGIAIGYLNTAAQQGHKGAIEFLSSIKI